MKQLKRSSLVIMFLLGFLGGVGVGDYFGIMLIVVAGISLAGALLILFGRRFVMALLAGLVFSGLALGMLRVEVGRHVADSGTVDFYNDTDQKVILVGQIGEEPDRRADSAKYVLEVSSLDGKKIVGRILLKTDRLPEYFYGDVLSVTGQLKAPFETEDFSYREYLARYDIFSTVYYPRVEKLDSGRGNFFFAQIFAFKRSFENQINQIFPEPQASFMAGLLIGSRRGIPDTVTQEFNTTGLTHIIAISGYNIALVIAVMTGIFGTFVPRRWQFPLAAFFVVAFTILVGAGAAVVRAAIMGLLAFYALTHGRQYQASLALVLTAALMIAFQSKILLHDVSFQLSFAAVAGLMFVSPVLEKYFAKVPNKFAIRESLLMTMSAQVMAVPLIVFYFGRLSFVAPLTNLLVAPAIPLAMLTGFIAVVVGAVFLPAGILLGLVAHILLSYILWIAHVGAQLPGASLDIGWFGVVFVLIYYVILIVFLLRLRMVFLGKGVLQYTPTEITRS